MYDVNPMQLIQMIKNGSNPQQLMLSILSGPMKNTPMGANLFNLVQQGNTAEIEKIARNLSQSQGIDFDTALAQFKRQMGLY